MSQASPIAHVVTVRGSAFAINQQAASRSLKPGDPVREGEAVVTSANGELRLLTINGREIKLGQSERLLLDGEVSGNSTAENASISIDRASLSQIAQALNEGESLDTLLDEEAPAAGAGQASEGGHSFVEFARLVEQIEGSGAGYLFGTDDRSGIPLTQDDGQLIQATQEVPDTTPPNGGAAPTVIILEDANNDGFINRQELQGDVDIRVQFDASKVDIGDTVRVEIRVNGTLLETRNLPVDAQAKSNGYVDLAVTPPDHGSTLRADAIIIDPAGNSTLPGSKVAKIDTSDLQGLKVTIVEDSNQDGFINKSELDGLVDIRIDLPPEAIAGDSLMVSISGQPPRQITLQPADIDAKYFMLDIEPPANGTRIEVSAYVKDSAGNQSNTDTATAIMMIGDVKAPAVTISEDSNQDGWINAAELQGDIDVRIGLPDTARAGDILLITINGVERPPILLTPADIANKHVDLAGIPYTGDGPLSVTAQLRDPAGNLSPIGSATAVIDTTVFTNLKIAITEDSNQDGFISIAELKDNDIDVRVTLPDGAAIGDSLTVNASGNNERVVILTAAHLADGYVDFKFDPTADQTDFVATARISDSAGNSAGPVSASARMMLSEPGAPTVTIVEDRNNDGWINAAELQGDIDISIVLPGTANVGDSLLITVNGQARPPIILSLDDIRRGGIDFAVASPGEGQRIEVTAQVRDPAGNLGKQGEDWAIIDTTPPNGGRAPTVIITEDTNNDGFISATELDGDVDIEIHFERQWVDVDDVLIVSIDGGLSTREITLTAADIARGFITTHYPPQAHGSTIKVEAWLRDPAGNETPKGSDEATFWTNLIIDNLVISVSEEGLANGIKDDRPDPVNDTTDEASASGTLGIINGNANLSLCLIAPTEALYSNGVRIVWSGDGTEASPLVGRAGLLGPEIICAKIDAQGNYDVRLLGPVDHPDPNSEDVLSLNFTIRASDASQTTEATLTLRIEDDAPLARDQEIRVGQGDGVDTNLMIMLDLSASMKQCTGVCDLNGQEFTRLDLAKLAIKDLLDRYDALGEVMVRLVVFGNDGQAIGDRWLTITEARTALATLEASNEASNYDAALATARTAFADAGRISHGQNVSYFFSDGEPTIDSSGHPFNYPGQFDPFLGDGIDRDEECDWRDFLNEHDITSHAIGVGPRTLIIPNQLNPIAWDGQAEADLNGYWIGDFNEMACVFATTVGGPTSLGGSLGGFGADGGHVALVEVGGYAFAYDAQRNTLTASGSSDSVSTWRFDPVARTLTVETTAGERIQIGLCDGSYQYHVDHAPARGHKTEIRYTLVDGDGDQASGSLAFIGTGEPSVVNQAPVTGIETSNNLLGIIGLNALDLIDLGTRTRFTAFDANNDIVKLEIAYRSLVNLGPYHLKASYALADELGLTLSIINNPGLLGLLLPSSMLVITAKDGGNIDNLRLNELLGTVHYEQSLLDVSVLSATSISATDSHGLSHSSSVGSLAEVGLLSTPNQDGRIIEGSQQDDTLVASQEGSRLYGYAGDDTLVGSAGNDLLRGGAGDDTLYGNNGNDVLIGGQGNDILWGGAGSDIFRWEFGDQGTVDAPAIDHVMDFNQLAPVGAGGDVLDLRDLLQGEYHLGSDPGNLTQYLHFETTAGKTTIHINPLGNGTAVTQQIVLDGVDLSHGGHFVNNTEIIQNLLQQGKLLVD